MKGSKLIKLCFCCSEDGKQKTKIRLSLFLFDTMKEAGFQETIDFMSGKDVPYLIHNGIAEKMFSNNPTVSELSISQYFGNVNRGLRHYCMDIQKSVFIMMQYGVVPSLLGFWREFQNRLYDYADIISDIFEMRTIKKPGTRPGGEKNHAYFQIVQFGVTNWKNHIMQQKNINNELLSIEEFVKEKPKTFPFTNIKVINLVLRIFQRIKDEPKSEKMDIDLLLTASSILRLFFNHTHLYPITKSVELRHLMVLSQTLKCLKLKSTSNPNRYLKVKNYIINKLKEIERDVDDYSAIKDSMDKKFNIFENSEYFEILQMRFKCNPDYYIEEELPKQVNALADIVRQERINIHTSDIKTLFARYETHILPIYERLDAVVAESLEARRELSRLFTSRLFPRKIVQLDARSLFAENKCFLRTVWRLCRLSPEHVICISNAFIAYFRQKLEAEVTRGDNDSLQALVSKINSMVTFDFENDQAMVLARSVLYIPYQSDSQLIGRARGLIEQAHEPLKMQASIAELFDIVPYVRARNDLFSAISEFIQNTLMSQADPNLDLEESMADRMGQYIEYQYVSPLKRMIEEFKHRFDLFEKYRSSIKPPPAVRIAILSSALWKNIVKRGRLSVFREYDSVRKAFEEKFHQVRKHEYLHWCDPSSVVEVEIRLSGEIQKQPFLFNGIQWAIVHIALTKGAVTREDMNRDIVSDEIDEQVSALEESGMLVREYAGKFVLPHSIGIETNRNFARKYTSAENVVLRQLKEEDTRHAVDCAIVRALKVGPPAGLYSTALVDQVVKMTVQTFFVRKEVIREQIRALEVKKYIECNDDGRFTLVK